MPVPPISLGAVNMLARSPVDLARFWTAVTGGTPTQHGETVYLSAASDSGFALFFQPTTADRPEPQMSHLDLTVPWGSREDEVARILGLGAAHRWDVLDEFPQVRWTTLADPEGNLFCVAEWRSGGAA